jgi:hypothetical protein
MTGLCSKTPLTFCSINIVSVFSSVEVSKSLRLSLSSHDTIIDNSIIFETISKYFMGNINIFKIMTFKLKLSLILIILMSCSDNVDSISTCETIDYPNKPSVDWFQSYGGSGEESHGHYILSTNDGGYIQIGETGFLTNNAKILVVKINHNGEFGFLKLK